MNNESEREAKARRTELQRFEKRVLAKEESVDKKAETLVVKNIWYEPGIRQTKKLNAAVDAAVRRLAKFNDCSRITK